MLYFDRIDCVENPIEAKYRIHNHGGVVHPNLFIAKRLSQKWIVSIRIAQTEVHEYIPYAYASISVILPLARFRLTAIDRVKRCEGYEDCSIHRILLYAIDTKGDVEDNRCCVLSTIDKMRENIPSIVVTTNALQCPP